MGRPRIRKKAAAPTVELFDLSGVNYADLRGKYLWVEYGRCRTCRQTLRISANAVADQLAIESAADYHIMRCAMVHGQANALRHREWPYAPH